MWFNGWCADEADVRKAARRRAVVRRSNLGSCHLMAAKHIRPDCCPNPKPNRRAVGRPGDARRPAALSRAGECGKGSNQSFAAICAMVRLPHHNRAGQTFTRANLSTLPD